MKYALLIYEDEQAWGEDKSGALLNDMVGQHMSLISPVGSLAHSSVIFGPAPGPAHGYLAGLLP
jgi:hypothetical protein